MLNSAMEYFQPVNLATIKDVFLRIVEVGRKKVVLSMLDEQG